MARTNAQHAPNMARRTHITVYDRLGRMSDDKYLSNVDAWGVMNWVQATSKGIPNHCE